MKCDIVFLKLNTLYLIDKNMKLLLLNFLSFLKIPLAILFVMIFEYVQESNLKVYLLFIVIFSLELSDFLDGKIARKFNLESNFGAVFDPYTDSISRLIVFWSFSERGYVFEIIPLFIAFRDITVSYCRIILSIERKKLNAKFSGKLKAVLLALFAFILVFTPFYSSSLFEINTIIISWAIIAVSIFSSMEYIHDALRNYQIKSENYEN